MNAMPVKPRGRKRGKVISQALPLVISEHGLEARYLRGDVMVDRQAADPDHPNRTLSRPRTFSAYDRMQKVGAISEDQRDACDRYAILREQELGASWQAGEHAGSSRPGWEKGNPTQTAILASAALRSVHKTLGQQARTTINLLIMNNMHAKAMAAHLGLNENVVRGRIDAALTRMVEHWDLEGEYLRNWMKAGK